MARTETLTAFLTDVADAIRSKKGTTDTIKASDFDTEIENLPSGSTPDGYDKIASLTLANPCLSDLSGTFTLTIPPSCTTLVSLFNGDKNRCCDVVINNPDNAIITNMSQTFVYSGFGSPWRTTRNITLNFDTSKVTTFYRLFALTGTSSTGNTINVYGQPLNFTSATNLTQMFGNYSYSSNYPISFSVVPNTIKISWSIGNAYLTQDTLISVANGLSNSTQQTLTIAADLKTLASAILGTVNTDTMFFTYKRMATEDEPQDKTIGEVNLQDFITNEYDGETIVNAYKGWTLA